jgi:hypothetical protein
MNTAKTTPKDFFLWAGAMIALYWSVIAFIFLLFGYIDYAFPNALQYYPANPYDSGISFQMASIIVLLPVYLILIRVITKEAERDPSRREIWVRRWAIIFTLFVAGIAIVGDLIALLHSFLSGEALTTAFLLKVAIVLLVAAGVFMHFIADLKGYWAQFPNRRRYVSAGVAIVAIASIVAGFFIVGTPMHARLARLDEQKVQDLQNIQSQVTYYWQAKRTLPKTLESMVGLMSMDSTLPIDSQTGTAYEYEITGPLSFQLCAIFSAEDHSNESMAPFIRKAQDGVSHNWDHGKGRVCFNRTIDPAFYPPLTR